MSLQFILLVYFYYIDMFLIGGTELPGQPAEARQDGGSSAQHRWSQVSTYTINSTWNQVLSTINSLFSQVFQGNCSPKLLAGKL